MIPIALSKKFLSYQFIASVEVSNIARRNIRLDNVKINKYAKFDPNIPCGSRVMSVFTNLPQPAEMMLSKH